jgi:hypothetical protein
LDVARGVSNSLTHLFPPLHSVFIRALAIVCMAGCQSRTRFETKLASDFNPSGHTVSVLGVYKDGQMSSDAWGQFAPRVERALGGGPCEIGYGSGFARTNGVLTQAIDDYTRANGPTDDLLAQLTPAARGHLIMILIVDGHLPTPVKSSLVDDAHSQGTGASLRPGTPGVRGQGRNAVDPDVLEVSASLYSVARHHSVALVRMQYSGGNIAEATASFAAQLSQSLPGAVCSGWSWSDQVDPERIRRLGQE